MSVFRARYKFHIIQWLYVPHFLWIQAPVVERISKNIVTSKPILIINAPGTMFQVVHECEV